jgi:single-stranded DNA-binding protein
LAQYLRKGDNTTVSGEFSITEYDGKPQLNIRANEVALQGGKPSRDEQHSASLNRGERKLPADDLDDDLSDLPF